MLETCEGQRGERILQMQSLFMEGFLVWEMLPAFCGENELVLVHEKFCFSRCTAV